MGFGKTQALINFINRSNNDIRFMYVTPYLNEVTRIKESCSSKGFMEPKEPKFRNIKWLLKENYNIVTTHKLFSMFDDDIVELITERNYLLIMDEVPEVVEQLDITRRDKNIILRECATIKEEKKIIWYDHDYPVDGKYGEYMLKCYSGCIGIYGDNVLMELFPVSIFKAFKETYILTYLFMAQMQKYYYDYYGIKYRYLYVKGHTIDTYCLTDNINERNDEFNYGSRDYRKLIHIYDGKLNKIGDPITSLSFSWYDRHKNTDTLEGLKKNCTNFFAHSAKTKSNLNMWTTFKEYENIVGGNGFKKGFVSCNMRATNEYKHKTTVAYLINRYLNPYNKGFFTSNGVTVDEDMYATSELLQFLFRSAIRDGKEILVYIPSSRMRFLLEQWIDSVSPAE